MSETLSHAHHYVPQWYQRRFLQPGCDHLELLDLHPQTIVIKPGKSYKQPGHRRRTPSQCFVENDLYMLRFKSSTTDRIEKMFFGEIDRKGSVAVDTFSRMSGFNPELTKAHQILLPYMGAQRFRTPRGLDWLKKQSGTTDHNRALLFLQRTFQQHTTMWGEAIWEIVSARLSRTKFIVSDQPVTLYNQMLPPSKCRYPGSEELNKLGTRTLFPLGPNHCLIITHLQYVRNATANPLQIRVNARQYEQTLTYVGNIQFGRELDEAEVLKLNLILKLKAVRYVAAGKREWLYPEAYLPQTGWATLDYDWFMIPNPWKVRFSTSIMAGYNDGTYWAVDEYGHRPDHLSYNDKARREREWKTRRMTQHAWSKKRVGKSLSRVYDELENRRSDSEMTDYLAELKPSPK